MEKSTFTPLYALLRARLVQMREKADLTQRELARRLGRERSFVSRIELGERRLDLVEFFWVVKALGQDAAKVAMEIMRAFRDIEASSPGRRRRG